MHKRNCQQEVIGEVQKNNHYFSFSLFYSLILALNIDTYDQSVVLDPQKRIVLSWKVTGDMIDFEVAAQTSGWVGIGFSPNGAMTGADILIGWIDRMNKAHISV